MAKLKVFVVRDLKVEAYLQPFFCRTAGEALRTWETTCNDEKTMMHKYPTDYMLFESAEFDEATGRFEPYEQLKPLGTAKEYVRKPDSAQSISA